jgi:TatD DNase family protein
MQQVAQAVPLEALVVETDSPYGAPQKYRGRRNEPANVSYAVEKIAELRGEKPERVARVITENSLRLFAVEGKAWERSKVQQSA